jgi:hypothetical protein
VTPLANSEHRDRCFGRDPLDVATEIHVEHRVANDGDATVFGPFEKAKDPITAERMRHRTHKLAKRLADRMGKRYEA